MRCVSRGEEGREEEGRETEGRKRGSRAKQNRTGQDRNSNRADQGNEQASPHANPYTPPFLFKTKTKTHPRTVDHEVVEERVAVDQARPPRAGRRERGHLVAASGEKVADHCDEGVAVGADACGVFVAAVVLLPVLHARGEASDVYVRFSSFLAHWEEGSLSSCNSSTSPPLSTHMCAINSSNAFLPARPGGRWM